MPPKYNQIPKADTIELPKPVGSVKLTSEQYKDAFEALTDSLENHEELFVDDKREMERLWYYNEQNIALPFSVESLQNEEGRKNLVDMAAANRLFVYRLGTADRRQITLDVDENGEMSIQPHNTMKEVTKKETKRVGGQLKNVETTSQVLPDQIEQDLNPKLPKITFGMAVLHYLTLTFAYKDKYKERDDLLKKQKAAEKARNKYVNVLTEMDQRFNSADVERFNKVGYAKGEKEASKKIKMERIKQREADAFNREHREAQSKLEKEARKEYENLYTQLHETMSSADARQEADEMVEFPMKPHPLAAHGPVAANASEEFDYHRELKIKKASERSLAEASKNEDAIKADVDSLVNARQTNDPEQLAKTVNELIRNAISKNPASREGTVNMKAAVRLFNGFKGNDDGVLDDVEPYVKGMEKLDHLLDAGRSANIALLEAAAEKTAITVADRNTKIDDLAASRKLAEHLQLYAGEQSADETPKALTSEKSLLSKLCGMTSEDKMKRICLKDLDAEKLHALSPGNAAKELNDPKAFAHFRKEASEGEKNSEKTAGKRVKFNEAASETTYERSAAPTENKGTTEKKLNDTVKKVTKIKVN